MNSFGYKAFFRALAIVGSVYLVKTAIGVVSHAEGLLLKTGYSLGFFVAILFILLLPGILFPTRHEDPNPDRNTEE